MSCQNLELRKYVSRGNNFFIYLKLLPYFTQDLESYSDMFLKFLIQPFSKHKIFYTAEKVQYSNFSESDLSPTWKVIMFNGITTKSSFH